MKNLVVVESPTKARTIGRFLGKDYTIKPSMGHVMDLPKSTLGVALDKDFTPEYEVVEDKKKVIAELTKLAKEAELVLLATDPDREGEAIAAHVKDLLESSQKRSATPIKFQRIVFHEITKEAIDEALKNPRGVNAHLVDAQTARRVLDRLVGYKLSPLLWKKVRRGLSAGRVQSVALRLIVEREKEIEKFQKEEYWTITALLHKEATDVPFELVEIDGQKIETSQSFDLYDGSYAISKTIIGSEEKAGQIVSDVKARDFTVSDVLQKETKRFPQPPYTTSTLQQDASRRFGFTGKRTMSLAQRLYEAGYITYHRTDSVVLATSAIQAMRGFIEKTYGTSYVPKQPRFYTTKQKLAQEAHEAIRPTRVSVSADHIQKDLGREHAKLYEMIWRRAVASQMSEARIESTTVLVDTKGDHSYRFKATGSVLIFDGFLKVNPMGLSDTRLPEYIVSEKLTLIDLLSEKHETPPPPRYNDASLIATLEEKGIGRPSTYASIIGTIQERGYIEREEKKLVPSPVGTAVNDFLVKNFSGIDDIPFTAEMEDQLDSIAHGEKEWVPMMREFYTPFEKRLEKTEDAERVAIPVEQTNEICPECGSPLVIRHGRFGKFFSCSRFPECKYTKAFVEETNLTCPKDGGKIIVKKTRRGRKFFGCSNYPNCDFAAWKLEDIKKV